MNSMSKKIKVLTVIPGEETGSSMIFAKRQVESLGKAKIEVKVFFLASRTSLSKLISESLRFREMIKAFHPDVIHCHYGTMTSFFCTVNTSIPLVITFHGSDLNKTPSDGIIKDYIGRFLSQLSSLKAKRIICVGSKLVEKLWWAKRKAVVIPMGIDADKFSPYDKKAARKKLNWDEQTKVILFNSNNQNVKRLDIALKVFEFVKKRIPSAHLEILKGNVVPDMIPFYINASDCLLMCSDSEGGPMIIKEALACNLPIVATDVGDVKERLMNVSGTYVTLQDEINLSEKVIAVLESTNESEGRKKIISDELSEKQVAEKVEKIYSEVFDEFGRN